MKLALGTAQFGLPYGISNKVGKVPQSEVRGMLQLASKAGIDLLDTAISYGESESRLGAMDVSRFRIVTKLPSMPIECGDVSDWVNKQVNASLTRLCVKNLDTLLLHNSMDLLSNNGRLLYEELQQLKINNKVQKIGISIYSPHELDAIDDKFSVDLVQTPFNLIDQRICLSGWLDELKARNIEVHARSIFLQGLLLMNRDVIPEKFCAWNFLWDKWSVWLDKSKISAAKACLDFVQSFNQFDRIIVGADSTIQLNDLIEIFNSEKLINFPKITSSDEDLIIPSRWF